VELGWQPSGHLLPVGARAWLPVQEHQLVNTQHGWFAGGCGVNGHGGVLFTGGAAAGFAAAPAAVLMSAVRRIARLAWAGDGRVRAVLVSRRAGLRCRSQRRTSHQAAATSQKLARR
jgi:hypothetical protein